MTGNRQTGEQTTKQATEQATEMGGRLATVLLLLLAAQLLCGFEPFRTTVDAVERGNALLAGGKPKEALEQYAEAAKEQPDLAGVHYNRALALEKLGKLDEARKALLRSTQSSDQQLKAKSFYNLGNVLYQLKQHDEAVTAYQNALRLNPGHQAAKWNLELALRQLEEQKKKEKSEKKDDKNKDDKNKDDKNKDDKNKGDKQQKQDDKQDKQKQDDEQDKQKQDKQKQDKQKQDKQKQDKQKQDDKRSEPKDQPQAKKPEQRPPAEQRMQQLLDSLDRKDRNLQRWRARMMQRHRRPPERDW